MPKGKVKNRTKTAKLDMMIIQLSIRLKLGRFAKGTEIKSIRNGRINLKDGFARIRNGEAFWYNVHISPYEQGNILIMTHYVPENYYYTKQINKLIGETKIQVSH